MFKSKKSQVLMLFAVIAAFCYSCKKSAAVNPVSTPVKPTTDIITKNGLTLFFINRDTTYEKDGGASRSGLENTFFIVYPEIKAYFNPQAPDTVHILIDPAYTGIAYTLSDTIHVNPVWMLANQKDLNMITHESTHVVQNYTKPNDAGWLVEGLAEYSRNKFGIDNAAVGWYIPDYSSDQKYTDGYTTVARFILWAEATYKRPMAQALDKALRDGTYSDDATWTALTGSTFNQLWDAYVINPYY